jgi:hypothetical protein
MSLPPPIDLTRQIGISAAGSPIALSRSSSTGSDRSVEDSVRARLETYLVFLQHEVDFIGNEIQALIDRQAGSDRVLEDSFLDLRDRLKVRFNGLQLKKQRLLSLLEVM